MTSAPGTTAPAPWHTLTVTEVVGRVRVDPDTGLERAEAARRLAEHGPNELPEHVGRGLLQLAVEQVKDVMILLLVVAAVVSGLVGEPVDTIAIVVIVLLNATIGVVQAFRAEKAIEALRSMAAPQARVVRDGVATDVPSAQLVVGDVVLLEAGGLVPADLRLIEVARLQLAEAALTGESVPVDKGVEPWGTRRLPSGTVRPRPARDGGDRGARPGSWSPWGPTPSSAGWQAHRRSRRRANAAAAPVGAPVTAPGAGGRHHLRGGVRGGPASR